MEITISEIPNNRDKFHTKGIIIAQLDTNILKNDQYIKIYKLADETGCIEYGLYNDSLNIGDIIKLENSYATFKNGRFRIFAGENKNIKRIGAFQMLFTEEPNLSDVITE